MKKAVFLCILVGCYSFTTLVKTTTYRVKLGYNCETQPIAVDSVVAVYDGQNFTYRIDWCSKPVTDPTIKRNIIFEMVFSDSLGNIIDKIAEGPVLTSKSKFSGKSLAGLTMRQKPYDAIITVSYVDTEISGDENTCETQYKIIKIRSLRLYKNKVE